MKRRVVALPAALRASSRLNSLSFAYYMLSPGTKPNCSRLSSFEAYHLNAPMIYPYRNLATGLSTIIGL